MVWLGLWLGLELELEFRLGLGLGLQRVNCNYINRGVHAYHSLRVVSRVRVRVREQSGWENEKTFIFATMLLSLIEFYALSFFSFLSEITISSPPNRARVVNSEELTFSEGMRGTLYVHLSTCMCIYYPWGGCVFLGQILTVLG